MKALFAAALVLFATIGAHATTPAELEAQAQKAYDERDFTQAGVQRAQDASNLFGQLAGELQKAGDKAKYAEIRVRQAAACFFMGDASKDSEVKKTQFWNGYSLAKEGVTYYQVKDVSTVSDADLQRLLKLSADDRTKLAEALYVSGINLGQWGEASGVMQSLNKWPELRDSMELMVKIGMKELHEYGAYRTLGIAYFRIPALLGGSVPKATQYLTKAVTSTLATGQVYSVNGFNNLFYAELLKDAGKDAEAKKILQDFLKADSSNLLPGYSAETKNAQRLANEMLKNW